MPVAGGGPRSHGREGRRPRAGAGRRSADPRSPRQGRFRAVRPDRRDPGDAHWHLRRPDDTEDPLRRDPEDPAQLARFAGQIATNLLAAKLPAPRVKGAHLDVEALAADLRAKRAQVDKLLKDVQREVREAQGTLAEKTAAIASYDQVFAGVAGTLSGLLLLSGQAELASRVRPSTRRPGQTAEEAGDEPAPADKPEEK